VIELVLDNVRVLGDYDSEALEDDEGFKAYGQALARLLGDHAALFLGLTPQAIVCRPPGSGAPQGRDLIAWGVAPGQLCRCAGRRHL